MRVRYHSEEIKEKGFKLGSVCVNVCKPTEFMWFWYVIKMAHYISKGASHLSKKATDRGNFFVVKRLCCNKRKTSLGFLFYEDNNGKTGKCAVLRCPVFYIFFRSFWPFLQLFGCFWRASFACVKATLLPARIIQIFRNRLVIIILFLTPRKTYISE